ncbi:MAG: NAD(P)-dependent oxidoreductase [Pseudanabaenaceae cyanobacterium bins.39]|nr:NAD(P)-dependent oxidoreductase [Pseudanabaenaceae cyanobacterium bins.39]
MIKSIKSVVITGASGTVGETVVDSLREHYELTLFDIKPHPRFPVKLVDLANWHEVYNNLPEADAIIHLAAIPQEDSPEKILRSNIQATLNVFEGARIRGIQRVIFASSIMTYLGHHRQSKPIQPLHPQFHTLPTTHYAVSKLYGEQLGQVYAHNFGLSVICIRLGWYPRIPTTQEHLDSQLPILISIQDCKRLFHACLAVETMEYAIVNGLSRGGKDYYDLDIGKELLGFYPNDDLEATAYQHRKRLGLLVPLLQRD